MNVILVVFVILVSFMIIQYIFEYNESACADLSQKLNGKKLSSNENSKQYSNKEFETVASKYFTKNKDWTKIPSTSVFTTWIKNNDFQIVDGKKIWNRVIFNIDPTRNYDQVRSDKKTVVIYPIFTDSAYKEPGFYTHYRNKCDEKCLTVKIQTNFLPQANPNAVQVLKLLGYSFVTDVDVDKNPSVLNRYDKVIVLHNEYVTKKEFDAITTHPHVIYLYPNALYAKVNPDYAKNTITLIQGHNYPEQSIRNGFDWKLDNSQFEYDRDCKKIEFHKVDNGWMLNCYPENIIHKSIKFLEAIKKI